MRPAPLPFLAAALALGCADAGAADTYLALKSRPLTGAERKQLERALAALPDKPAFDLATLRAEATRAKGAGAWSLNAELRTAVQPSRNGRTCWTGQYNFEKDGPAWKQAGGVRHVVWRNRGDGCRTADVRVSVGEQVRPATVERVLLSWPRLLGAAVPVIRGITHCATKRLGDLRLASIAQTERQDRVELGFALPEEVAGGPGFNKMVFVTYRVRNGDYTPWSADCAK